jgi:hypothetical protein
MTENSRTASGEVTKTGVTGRAGAIAISMGDTGLFSAVYSWIIDINTIARERSYIQQGTLDTGWSPPFFSLNKDISNRVTSFVYSQHLREYGP